MLECPQCGTEYDGGTHFCRDPIRLGAGAALAPEIPDDLEDATVRSAAIAPDTLVGSYRLINLLGEGGIGRVYVAEHVKLGRRVALKMLRSEHALNATIVKRFFGEAQAVNRIAHENIVTITDFVEAEDGRSYYIMELLEGETLGAVLRTESFLPIARAIDIAAQVCRALGAVHRENIVHRDLKPENIFLTRRGERRDFVKLLDFGVAKLSQSSGVGWTLTTAVGSLVGTPQYMSPEQATGQAVDRRADIYAFGLLLYEMITGANPFRAPSIEEMLERHRDFVPPPPSTQVRGRQLVPKRLDELIVACLEKAPHLRPASMDEIEGILQSLSVPAPGARPAAYAALGGAIAALLLLAGIAGYLLRGPTEDAATIEPSAARVEASKDPADTAPVVPTLPVPLPAALFEVVFDSTPRGAEVFRLGEAAPIGTTPFAARFPRSDETITFELRREGYQRALHEIAALERDTRVLVQLAASAPLASSENAEKPRGAVSARASARSIRVKPTRSGTNVSGAPRARAPGDPASRVRPEPGEGAEKSIDPTETRNPFGGR